MFSKCIHVVEFKYFFIYWYTQFDYPFICCWVLRLLPYLGNCKQCCYEHQGACIFSNYGFLQVYAHEWDCRIIQQLYFYSFKKPLYCFSQWLHQFTFLPTLYKFSLFSTSLPTFANLFICLFVFSYTTSIKNLSCLTRDQTHAPAVEAQSFNHWTSREVPVDVL